MIDEVVVDSWEDLVKRVLERMSDESREEESFVVVSLNERMNGITIRLHGGNPHGAILVLQFSRRVDTLRTFTDSFMVDSNAVFNLVSSK